MQLNTWDERCAGDIDKKLKHWKQGLCDLSHQFSILCCVMSVSDKSGPKCKYSWSRFRIQLTLRRIVFQILSRRHIKSSHYCNEIWCLFAIVLSKWCKDPDANGSSSKHHHDFVVDIKVILQPAKFLLSLRGIKSICLLVSFVNRYL